MGYLNLLNKDDYTTHFIVTDIEETITKTNKVIKRYIGIFYYFKTDKVYTNLYAIRNAIRLHYKTVKEFYDENYKMDDEGYCVYCGKETKFVDIVSGYKHCCGKCSGSRNWHNLLLKYSANKKSVIDSKIKGQKEYYNNLSDKELEEKKKDISLKRIKTLYERYGNNYLSDRAKNQWNNLSDEERKLISKKANETKKRNGTLNCSNAYNQYMVIDESTNKFYSCQGYEDIFIKFLISEKIKFVNKRLVPKIPYFGNKSGFVYPDLFLPELNLIVEVKSDFTLYVGIDKQMIVSKTAFDYGYNYCIFESKGRNYLNNMFDEEYNCCKSFMNMLIRSQGQFLKEIDKVQRLSCCEEYKPIVFGLGNGRVPLNRIILNPQWNVI